LEIGWVQNDIEGEVWASSIRSKAKGQPRSWCQFFYFVRFMNSEETLNIECFYRHWWISSKYMYHKKEATLLQLYIIYFISRYLNTTRNLHISD
jgi:hypothetical protein